MRPNTRLSIPALRRPLAGLALALIVAGCGLLPYSTPTPEPTPVPTPVPTAAPQITPRTGSFIDAGQVYPVWRYASATLLRSGHVLIAGGAINGQPTAAAQLYIPETGKFQVVGSMTKPRSRPTATLLPNGRVLITGGANDNSAEIFDPETGRFSKTGNEYYLLDGGRAVVSLNDGRVLLVGGYGGGMYTPYSEIYFSSNGKFSHVTTLITPRANAAAVMLDDGRVLIAGGDQALGTRNQVILNSTEFYNPATGKYSAGPTMVQARTHFSMILLQDGRVLAFGGINPADPTGILSTAEVYNPRTFTWTAVGSMGEVRFDAPATMLLDGRVFVLGGGDRLAELFDPATNTFERAGFLLLPRDRATVTTLHDGRVLITGGTEDSQAEFYSP